MLTTLLIFVPIVAALVVWTVPLPRGWSGGVAFVAAFAEVGLWIGGAARFDYQGDLQYSARHDWFADLGVSYHVGFFGYSLWLAGLAVVVCALAIAYGVWADRERPRAYFGLMLFLTGSIVGVFASQDLLLFYAFFEAMLIPIYVLVGVWGGPRRIAATVTFVIYTMAGSLLMLAADRRLRHLAAHVQPRRLGSEREQLGLPRLRDRVRGEGAAAAVPRLAAHGVHRGPARGGRDPVGRRLQGSRLRLHPDRPAEVPRARRPLPRHDPRARGARARSTARCSRSASRTSAA